jgi:hypothetical protein
MGYPREGPVATYLAGIERPAWLPELLPCSDEADGYRRQERPAALPTATTGNSDAHPVRDGCVVNL